MFVWTAKRLVSAATFAACAAMWMFIFGWTAEEAFINFSIGLAVIGGIRVVFDIDVIGAVNRYCESRRQSATSDMVASR